MINLNEELEDLYVGDHGADFEDYSDSCFICDTITELADSYVDVYTFRLWDWAKDNTEWCEQALTEVGGFENRCFEDIFRYAQFLCYCDEMYSNIDDIIFYVGYKYHINKYGEEISEDKFDKLNEVLEETTDGDRFWVIYDAVNDLYKEEDEDDE